MAEDTEVLVAAVRASAKYAHVTPDLIRHIGTRELAKGRRLKEATKATKDRLHQVGGAYLAKADYGGWLALLEQAVQAGNAAALQRACARIMGHHASTRERLPILESYYAITLHDLPPIRSVLDVACGLNPLAIPWMPLAAGAQYHACDIYEDMVAFIGRSLALLGVPGSAEACDVLQRVPGRHFHLALLLKSLPCLEQIDREATVRLLDAIDADHLLVSFPVRSLGGRDVGMLAQYEARFRALAEARQWSVERFAFESELAFLVDK